MDTAANWVTQSWTLCPGWPGSPCDWGSHIPQNSTEGKGCEQQQHHSHRVLQNRSLAERCRALPGEAGRWPGVAAGTAVELSDSHPPTMSAMHTAAAWLHYKGASQQHMRWLRCQWLWALLRLYFTSLFATALQAQARFYGIQSISLNDLVVRYWPDSAFPDLDYKRKTASGRFKCRSVDMLYQSSSAEHGSTRPPPGPIP